MHLDIFSIITIYLEGILKNKIHLNKEYHTVKLFIHQSRFSMKIIFIIETELVTKHCQSFKSTSDVIKVAVEQLSANQHVSFFEVDFHILD